MAEKDNAENFLSLEDETKTNKASKSKLKLPKIVKKKQPSPADSELEKQILEAEIIDDTVVEQPNGIYEVQWPLVGMDCPDCASKAFNALDHLLQTTEVKVSATTGEVSLKVDLEHGFVSQVSSVLKSLGHPPNLSFYQLSGVNARVVAKRNKISLRDVEKLLLRQPGILDVEVNKDNQILVQLLPAPSKKMLELRDNSLTKIIGTKPIYNEVSSTRLRPDQWRLFGGMVAIPILAIIMLGEMVSMPKLMIGFIASIGIFVGGLQMFNEAIASLLSRQMGFQVLTSTAVIGASIIGFWEEALMVVILVSIAAHLENSALEKARKAMQGGLDRIPRTARRMISKSKKNKEKNVKIENLSFQLAPSNISNSQSMLFNQNQKSDDESEIISLDLLHHGDIIEIRSGELIPADGKIIEGFGALDKAPLTGEAAPVEVSVGDEIHAGLILARGPVLLDVTAVGNETRLSGIIEAVHSFKEQKPEIQNLIEKFSAIWVPIVLFGALIVWYTVFPDDWKIILLLWVVACPCALLMAAAMPHAAALSRSSRMGAIVRGGDILERLSKVNHVLLDKTGTLTSGKPKIGEIIIAKGKQKKATLALAGGLEKRSSHPYAQAILEHLKLLDISPTQVSGINDIEAGVKGTVSGKEVYFIRADMADMYKIKMDKDISKAIGEAKKQGIGMSILAREGTAIALFTFIHDDTRTGSKELIHGFNNRSISVEILSGDQQSSVSNFASQIGLPDKSAHGGLSPEQKVTWVEKRSQTHVTMMVGDGFNDSAALAVADVGIAVGTGESVNMDAADIMFPGDEPRTLIELHDLSRKMHNAIVGNIAISMLITFTLVIAVINGWYDQLWVGVLIHEASVLLVILNGARLAGKDNVLAILIAISKTLWFDTIAVFKQFKQHYFTQSVKQNTPEIDLHATS